MKKTILSTLGAAALLYLCQSQARAQMLTTVFNFNDGQTSGSTATATTLASSHGETSAITTTFAAANVQVVTGSAVNAYTGDTAGNALNLQGGTMTANNGATIRFAVDTTNFTSLTLSFADKRSASGFNLQTFAYSTDGTTFTDFGSLGSTLTTSFAAYSIALPTAAENQAALTIRVTFAGATGATGTNSFDNVQLIGTQSTAVPEPSTYAALGLGILGMFAMQRARRCTA